MEWLQAMPAIPLRAGVPVIHMGDHGTHTVLSTGHGADNGIPAAAVWDGRSLSEVFVLLDELRVDLNDSLGFGHALTVWSARLREGGSSLSKESLAVEHGWRDRWLSGCTTDDDRLLLAQVLQGGA